ncbi:hypothetical protein [Achromobacter xylosoxidans]|uniref:hypothetical protein n=1 Tax=Alcaligenes xylosoxydans xylosoxydans TaxID=85698 RepID=UPI001F134CA2|nr:hypothetical protein [Achromobacter xylosoxidans]
MPDSVQIENSKIVGRIRNIYNTFTNEEPEAMPLTVVAPHAAIVTAINSFDPGYHHDYHLVKGLATPYLAAPTEANAALLADALGTVLVNWGAGSRKAPSVRALPALIATLLNPTFHDSLLGFKGGALAMLAVVNGHARSLGGLAAEAHCTAFDTRLLSVLSDISALLLIGNTNVTYPMKVLLLLTGFMPALDSQVRRGLSSAGFAGASATQFLMPGDMGSLRARKLTRLPFYLGDCFAANRALLIGAAADSHYPWLVDEPGRLFDILLFMQGSGGAPLFKFVPRVPNWYALS